MEKHLVLLALAELLLLCFSATYLLEGQLLSWDSIGHRAEAIVYKENIFPGLYGWNSYFLFGYPIESYPPLSRYLLSMLMVFFDSVLSAKILTIAAVLAVPVSTYFFLRKWGYEKSGSSCAALLCAAFMAFFSSSNGVSLYSALFVGALANFIALPMTFLALAYYRENPKLAAVFAALVILAHLIFAINMLIALAAIFLFHIYRTGFKANQAAKFSIFLLLAFALSSFWAFPFAEHLLHMPKNVSYVTLAFRPEPMCRSVIGLALCLGALFIIKTFEKHRAPLFLAAIFVMFSLARLIFLWFLFPSYNFSICQQVITLLTGVSLLFLIRSKDKGISSLYFIFLACYFTVTSALFGLSYLQIQHPFQLLIAHINRFDSFLYLIEAGIVGLAIPKIIGGIGSMFGKNGKEKYAVLACYFAVFIALFAMFAPAAPYKNGADQLLDFPKMDMLGRSFVIALPHNGAGEEFSNSQDYQLFYSSRKPIVRGLFVEEAAMASTAFGQIYSSMSYLLGYERTNWSYLSIPTSSYYSSNYGESLRFYSDLFWITDVLVEKSSTSLVGDYDALGRNFQLLGTVNASGREFLHYRLGNFSVVQARQAQQVCFDDYGKFNSQWFASGETQLYYYSCGVPAPSGPTGRVELEEYKNGYVRFRAESDSGLPMPVLFKEAYQENWKAYANGREIEIYRATPGFMMVFANGEVVMEYGPGPAHYAGLAVSALGVIALIFFRIPPGEENEVCRATPNSPESIAPCREKAPKKRKRG